MLLRLVTCLCLCTIGWANALFHGDALLDFHFPIATVNEFGFSGPVDRYAVEAFATGNAGSAAVAGSLTKLGLDPLIVWQTAGPIDGDTAPAGVASASSQSAMFGRLANLTNAPLDVLFFINLTYSLVATANNPPLLDHARTDLTFQFIVNGATLVDYADFAEDNVPQQNAILLKQQKVTIAPMSVVAYQTQLTLNGFAYSFFPPPPNPPPDPFPLPPPIKDPIPEPSTLAMVAIGLVAALAKFRRR